MSENNENEIQLKIGKSTLKLGWDSRQWIYHFGKSGPYYLTTLESVYNHLTEDLIKYKKVALDYKGLQLCLETSKESMHKILNKLGKALDEKRSKLTIDI